MNISAPQYLSELNAAKHTSILDWYSPEEDTYEMNVGKLRILVKKAAGEYRWSLTHERSGALNSGSSETLTLAGLEAIAYAENWVKKGNLVGLMS